MPAGVIYDSDSGGSYADLTVAKPCSELRYSRGALPPEANAFVVRQSFTQLRSSWARQAMGSVVLGSYYLVEETELQDIGGGMVMWDRVWATLPANFQRNIIVSKHYQAGEYVFQTTDAAGNPINPAKVTDQSIVSWTKDVTGVCYYEFYNGAYGLPLLPNAPFIQTIKYFGSQAITDLGSGFPTMSLYGNNVYSNNFAFSFVRAEIEPYMGLIVCLKKIYG